MTTVEIAEILGITESTVQNLKFQTGRKKKLERN